MIINVILDDWHSYAVDVHIIAITVCAALVFPVVEYRAKQAVWSVQNTNIPKRIENNSVEYRYHDNTKDWRKRYWPTVEIRNKRLLPTLSQRKPAMIATIKLKIFKMPFWTTFKKRNIRWWTSSQSIIVFYCQWLSLASKLSIFDDDERWDILPRAMKTLLRSILRKSVCDAGSKLWL